MSSKARMMIIANAMAHPLLSLKNFQTTSSSSQSMLVGTLLIAAVSTATGADVVSL